MLEQIWQFTTLCSGWDRHCNIRWFLLKEFGKLCIC